MFNWQAFQTCKSIGKAHMYYKLQNIRVGEIVHPNMTGIVKTKTVPFPCRDPGRSPVEGGFSVILN